MKLPVPIHIDRQSHILADESDGLLERYEVGCSKCVELVDFVLWIMEREEQP